MTSDLTQNKGLLFASLTAFLWGILAIALKLALNYFDSYTIVWFRFFLAFLILLGYHAMKKPDQLRILLKPPVWLVLAAVLIGVNYIGYMQGVHYAGPGITQVLIQAGAITLGLVGFIFFKERLNWFRAFGFILAGLGFVFFYFQQWLEFMAQKEELFTGMLWTIMGAWAWTGYAVIYKGLLRTWPAQQLNMVLYGVPAILFIPFADFSLFLQSYAWWVWLLLVFLGVNTVIAYGSLSLALKYAEANRISIIITLNPVVTFLILEALLFFEVDWFAINAFPPLAYLGAFMVLIGAIVAIGLKKHKI
jgi:drug/metabolite transporter (DMT)-like permease